MRKPLHVIILVTALLLLSEMVSAQYQRTTKTLKSFDWLKTPVVENVDVKGGHHVIELGTGSDQVEWNDNSPTTVEDYINKFPNVFGVGTTITVPANNADTGEFITYRIKAWTSSTNFTLEIAEEITSWGVGVTYAVGQSVLFEGRLYVALTAHAATVATGANPSPRYTNATPAITYNTTDWRPAATKLFSQVATRDLLGTGVYQNAYEGDMVLVEDNGTGESELFVCMASDMAGVAQWYGVKTGFGMSTAALPVIKTFTAATNDEAAATTAVTADFSGATTSLALNTGDLALTVDTYNVIAIPQSWGRKEFYIGTDRLIDGLQKYIVSVDHDNDANTATIPYQVWVLDFIVPSGTALTMKVK